LATQSVLEAVNKDACAINACVMVRLACATCDVVNATGVDDTAQAEPRRGLSRSGIAAIIGVFSAVGGIVVIALCVCCVRRCLDRSGIYYD
jgi:hypothetical protein